VKATQSREEIILGRDKSANAGKTLNSVVIPNQKTAKKIRKADKPSRPRFS
jgi:hypothetical protein